MRVGEEERVDKPELRLGEVLAGAHRTRAVWEASAIRLSTEDKAPLK